MAGLIVAYNFYRISKARTTNLRDEAEVGYHPAWKKCLLKWLLTFLEENTSTIRFQIIITTHSSYLLSDLAYDQGLKGKAIVMKKDDFSQGVKHEDALKKDLAPNGGNEYLKAIPYYTNYVDFYNHYNNLPNRPDYDGFVTIREGIDWAKSHVGALKNPTPDNALYLDASKLDFGNITTSDFKNGVGRRNLWEKSVQFFKYARKLSSKDHGLSAQRHKGVLIIMIHPAEVIERFYPSLFHK